MSVSFKCACCAVIYDTSPCHPDDDGLVHAGVCPECIIREGLIPPTGAADEN